MAIALALASRGLAGRARIGYLCGQTPKPGAWPKRMLSFDWNAPPFLPEARAQRSFVIVRLEPVDATHTRVRLHHTGWGDGGQWEAALTYFDRAWGSVLGNLKTRFETGPQDWTGWLAQLRALHAAAAAKAKP